MAENSKKEKVRLTLSALVMGKDRLCPYTMTRQQFYNTLEQAFYNRHEKKGLDQMSLKEIERAIVAVYFETIQKIANQQSQDRERSKNGSSSVKLRG